MKRGDVWWLEHPSAGRRPACVLTRDAAIGVLSSVVIVPATRTIRGIPTEVALTPADGMPDTCVLSFDNVTVVPEGLLTERITRVPDDKLPLLCSALRAATGC